MNKQKGITLIVLVITIIIMLIIAGVSINSLTGQEGTISEAERAKIDAEEMALLEEIRIIVKGVASRKFEEPAVIEEKIQEQLNVINSENFETKPLIKQKDEEYTNEETGLKEYKKEGYTIIYGVYSSKAMFLDKDLKEVKIIDAVIGNPGDWGTEEAKDFEGKTAILTEYTGSLENVIIPNFVNGYFIIGLGTGIFSGNKSIQTVTFNEGLIFIQDNAFSNCTNITELKNFPIPTLTEIGEDAFYNCSGISKVYSDSQSDGKISFSKSNIAEIGNRAFMNCSLLSGEIQDILKKEIIYGESVFENCINITGEIDSEILKIVISNHKIPNNMFSGMSSLTGNLNMSDEILGEESYIKEIGNNAFKNCSGITGLDISNSKSLEKIGDYAFFQCKKMSARLIFDEGIKSIGKNAFYFDSAIIFLYLPKTLEYVGKESFTYCGNLTTVQIACGDVFDESVFWGCWLLDSVEFASDCTMTYIPKRFLLMCRSITSIELPNSIVSIKSDSFSRCTKLKNVLWSNSIINIETGAFEDCTLLEDLPLEDTGELIFSLTTIDSYAFENCVNLGIRDIDDTGIVDFITLLKNSNVTTIKDNAFLGCQYLGGVYEETLENSIPITIAISSSAFMDTNIKKAKSFIIEGTTITTGMFEGVSVILDSDGNVITELEIPEGITTIESRAFSGCTAIEKITIPNSVQTIGSYAFENCTSLKEVKNNSFLITEIKYGTFYNCKKLINAGEFPSVITIGSRAYASCETLEYYSFYNGLTTIGGSAFFGCKNLKEVIFPETLISLGGYCFENCNLLEKVDLSQTQLTEIPTWVFDWCNSLKEIKLNDKITTIRSYAFRVVESLEEITFPDTLTTIENGAFTSCEKLKSINGLDNVETIGIGTFSYCDNLSDIGGLSKITEIPEKTFYECYNITLNGLKNINWGEIKGIGAKAFYNCTLLEGSVKLHKDCQTNFSADAFQGSNLSYSFY